MIYIDYEAHGGITDVAFVYTSPGDDTPFQLEVPAHQPGDTIFVWARGAPGTPSVPEGRNTSNVKVADFNLIDQRSNSFVNNITLSWVIDAAGDIDSVAHTAGTLQIGIHVYRGVGDIGDVAVVSDILDNFGGEIPGLTLEDSSGDSRVFCGIVFNQLKDGASTPSTPTGLAKRLTSPSALGGGTGVSYDTTDGVSSFSATYVDAVGGAYYQAWAIELKV